jgi:transposase
MGRRSSYVAIKKATLSELYVDRGLTLREVADEVGVSVTTVRRPITDYKIRVRNRGTRPAQGDRDHRPANVLTRPFLANHYQKKKMTVPEIAEANTQ